MREKPRPQTRAGAGAVLSIGQLATHVGVTVRAIRHYHQQGLLAIADIDLALRQRISDLESLRHELAGLMAGEWLVLPAEVAELLDPMRSLGVSEHTMALERDGWTLLMAMAPSQVPEWAADKTAALADPDFQRLYLGWEGARDWAADDPRLVELATKGASWLGQPPS